ncbi:unnamed protein product [Closterium sp. Naga37s-1]|nr:unnamed protein product [Closterium sp. Naga37s-1]
MGLSSGNSRRTAAVSPAEPPAQQSGSCCYTGRVRRDADGSGKSSNSFSTRQPDVSCLAEGRAALPDLRYHSSRGTASARSISPGSSWAAYFHAKNSQGLPLPLPLLHSQGLSVLPSPLPLLVAELLETPQSVNHGGECGGVGRSTAVEAASAGARLSRPASEMRDTSRGGAFIVPDLNLPAAGADGADAGGTAACDAAAGAAGGGGGGGAGGGGGGGDLAAGCLGVVVISDESPAVVNRRLDLRLPLERPVSPSLDEVRPPWPSAAPSRFRFLSTASCSSTRFTLSSGTTSPHACCVLSESKDSLPISAFC